MRHSYALLFLLTAFLAPLMGRAQSSSVGIGTTSPDPKAALDISATGKGLLIPRMDSATRAGITAPPDGLMVFQTNGRKGFWYAVSGVWVYIPDKTKSGDNLGSHTATQNLNLGSNLLTGGGASGISVLPSGNVGVGTTTPTQRLDVNGATRTTNLQVTAGAAAGRVLTADAGGNATWQAVADPSATNELQTISKTGPTVTLSNGGGSFADSDNQTLSISGNTISLNNGGSVTVPSSADNLGNHTATQNLNLGANQLVGNGGSAGLSISSAGTVRVPQLAGTGPGRFVTLADDGTLLAPARPFGNMASAVPQQPVAVGAAVATGVEPQSVAVNAAGTRAYVVNGSSNTLQAYDINNPTSAPVAVGSPVATGVEPRSVAVNAAGTRAYVVNGGSNTLQAYDISNSAGTPVAVGAAVATGVEPRSVAVNAAGTRAYVVNSSDNTLQAYDISNPTSTPVAVGVAVPTGTFPRSVAVNAAGTRAYVISNSSRTLQAYDISNPAGAPVALGSPVATGNSPRTVALNAAGTRAYVVNFISRTLQAYDISNPAAAPVAIGSAVVTGSNPASVAVNAAGTRAYVLNSNTQTISSYDISDPAGTPVAIGSGVATGSSPTSVAVNVAGTHAYVVNFGSNTLQAFAIGTPPQLVSLGADGSLGSVDPSTLGDDLGSHTATQNLNLGTSQLVGNGGTSGLSVSAGGNVGVGTTTPTQRLDVVGTTRTTGLQTTTLQVTGGSLAAGQVLTSDASGTATWQAVPSSADNLGNHTATQSLNLAQQEIRLRAATDANHALFYSANWNGAALDGPVLTGFGGGQLGINRNGALSSVLRWTSAGRVGIGTAAPTGLLHLVGSETTTNGFGAAIQLQNTAAAITNTWNLRAGGAGTATPNGGFSIADDSGYRLTITNTGRVGIGTNSPAQMLDVAGNVRLQGQSGTGERLLVADAQGDVQPVYHITYSNNISGLATNNMTQTHGLGYAPVWMISIESSESQPQLSVSYENINSNQTIFRVRNLGVTQMSFTLHAIAVR